MLSASCAALPELELHRDFHDHVDGRAVSFRGREAPLADGVDRALIESRAETLQRASRCRRCRRGARRSRGRRPLRCCGGGPPRCNPASLRAGSTGAVMPVPGRYGPPPVPPPEPGPMPAPSPSPSPVPWPVPVPPPAPGPWLSVSCGRRLRAIHGMPARSRGSAATVTTGATTGGSGSALTGGGSTGRTTGGGSTRGGGRLTGTGLRSFSTPLRSAGGGGAGSTWPPPPPPPPGPGATRNTSRISFLSSGVTAAGLRHPHRRHQHEPGEHRGVQRPGERERQSRLAAQAGSGPEQRRSPAVGTLRANGPRRPHPAAEKNRPATG